MSFEEYYQTYLSKHRHPMNKVMHVIGNILTIAYILGVIIAPVSLWWLLLAPFVVYPTAVLGHILFEGNKPAFLSMNPIHAKVADWRMMYDWVKELYKSRHN